MSIENNYDILVNSLQKAAEYSASEVTTLFQELEFTPDQALEFIVSDKGRELGLNALFNADNSVRSYQYINKAGEFASDRVNEIVPYYNSNLGNATASPKSLFTSTVSTSTVLGLTDTILSLGSVNHYTPQTPLQETLALSARFAPPVQLASVACKLGKAIDGSIYDLATAIGLHPPESLNPATWDSIVSNDEGELAQAFNWLLELDGEGGVKCYADEESVAYCAQWLNEEGVFSTGGGTKIQVNDNTARIDNTDYTMLIEPVYQKPSFYGRNNNESSPGFHTATLSGQGPIYVFCVKSDDGKEIKWRFISRYPFTVSSTLNSVITTPSALEVERRTVTVNGESKEFYFSSQSTFDGNFRAVDGVKPSSLVTYTADNFRNLISPYNINAYYYMLAYQSELVDSPAKEGVSNNGGTVPNTTGWTDPQSTLSSLKQQYPDWFNDRLEVDTVQPDGSTKHYNYIKVDPPFNVAESGAPDTQTQPATSESVKSETATKTQLQTLIEALTQSLTKGQNLVNTDNLTEEELKTLPDGSNATNTTVDNNPPDTGNGNAPGVIVPTGSASSLWAVYHPSQEQLSAFGAWLWSSDFVEQIKRLFNDPMQAVIGVHKVFAPIPTGETRTIVCGYLDSGVSSPTVSSQYTEVDCGTVDCREYFGNVFDYDPHTKVSIYLPFIGVVPLKVSEVMRASINVTYGVDVITGACLAKVKVTRDGSGGILYSYGGSCACHYPISSGSYAGIISGIVTSAIGIAGGIMTGNPLSAIGGAMAGLHQAHTDVQRSGGFTGCAGAMGPKKPYLIIDRPQTRLAADFEAYQGKPANSTQFIGDCSGFVRATEVHFSAPGVFDEEAREVESLLKAGVKLD